MIELDDVRERLDVGRVHGWLASSYWSPGIERALVERAIAGSHCLGAYRAGEQVGFARAITDHATFAWITDVWVDEDGLRLGAEEVDALRASAAPNEEAAAGTEEAAPTDGEQGEQVPRPRSWRRLLRRRR